MGLGGLGVGARRRWGPGLPTSLGQRPGKVLRRPWGRHESYGWGASLLLSKQKDRVLCAAKEATHLVRYIGMKCVPMILIRRAGSALLKVLCISFVRKVGRSGRILREPAGMTRASDAGWGMANKASTADQFSTPLNWVLLKAPTLSAASALRFAINFSNTLLMLLSRDIGRYDLGRLGPLRPPSGMSTQLACFHALGKHPVLIEAVKRSSDRNCR